MSTLSANNLNIADVLRRTGSDGLVKGIAELLDQENGLGMDIPVVEGNLPRGHLSQQRTSLPTFATRNPNGSTATSKSTTDQNIESPEIIESFSEVDEIVLNYGGDMAALKASEVPAFQQGAIQTMTSRWISGNQNTTPGQINGLATRYSSTSNANGRNIILGGSLSGQTDNMSIYRINWGVGRVYGWYPRGTQGGLVVKDWGPRIVEDSAARKVMHAVQWQWAFGISVDDWRAAARIPNIDLSLLIAGTGADLFDKLIQTENAVRRSGNSQGRGGIYMNTTTLMMLEIQARNDVQAGGQLTWETVGGQRMRAFQGVPINIEDQLSEAETRVT